MTLGTKEREENQRQAYGLMLSAVGDDAFDTTLLEADAFAQILRTTWEDLMHAGCVERVSPDAYRLTPKGWLAALEVSNTAKSPVFVGRLGRVLATMKGYVKGRHQPKIVALGALAADSGEPEGFIFNIVESRASTSDTSKRRGAGWLQNARGRLVEIPVDFNMEPVDVAAALTVPHLERIEALEEKVGLLEEDRAKYHCHYCDAPLISSGSYDSPDGREIVGYEQFACGAYSTDSNEVPCPYGPSWPQLDEFEFEAEQEGSLWFCRPRPKTAKAETVGFPRNCVGATKEEAEENARTLYAPKTKGERRPKRSW